MIKKLKIVSMAGIAALLLTGSLPAMAQDYGHHGGGGDHHRHWDHGGGRGGHGGGWHHHHGHRGW